jgi:Undecaprenyl-phosphate glucose phosphotransferase
MLLDTERLLVDEEQERADDRQPRRGPLRPEQLLSVRQRQHRRLAAHRFRAADTVLVLAVTLTFLAVSIDGPLLATPIADAIPVLLGGWLSWRLLRSVGLYRLGRSDHLFAHLLRVAAVVASAAAVALVATWSLPTELLTVGLLGEWVAATAGGLVALHALWWGLVARWRRQGWLTPNLVVVGATSDAEELIATALEHRDVNILGVFDDRRERSPLAVLGVPVLGDTDAMLRHRVMPYVDLVVVTIDPTASGRVRQVMDRLSVLPNRLTLVFDDAHAGRRAAAIDQLAESPLAPLHAGTDADRKAFAKRVQDVVIGGLALVLAAPVLAVIAVAVRLDSPGPVFFRQRRHGFNNEEIVVWKFRTMRHEAADARAERQVTADDDRVTRVGRFLRKTSLDEVPQLFNVITGEMSLVGPRPHAIGMKTGDVESEQLVAEYAHRHRIKPGMTGWAAIHGSRGPLHAAADVARRVALDVEYIERQSFWLDLQIMLRTVPSMLGDRDAIR